MAVHASIVFTLFVYACIYTEVKCDSTCRSMMECTMYNIQKVDSKVDGMQSNMAAIVNQLSQIQVQIATDKNEMQQQMETDRAEMQQQMATEREDVQQDIASQNEEIVSQREEISSQKEELARQKEDVANQWVEIASQKTEIMSQKQEIQNFTLTLESELSEKASHHEKEELSSYVSFTAYATQTRGYNYGSHVMFDATLRSYGSAYSAAVSEFVCPLNAYYLISMSLLAEHGQKMYGRIMLDDEMLVIACALDDFTNPSSSQTMVTYCAAGQRIWVKCVMQLNRMYGDPTWPYSTFGVTMLRVA